MSRDSTRHIPRIIGSEADATAAPSPPPPAALAVPRILCFGDSLTEGFTRGGSMMHPYALSLSRCLGGSACVRVEEGGWSGEQTSSMLVRLGSMLSSAQQAGSPYDLVLLLGGTNDICHGVDTARIVGQIKAMHGLAHAHSPTCRTVGLTVPEIAPNGPELAGGAPQTPREIDEAISSINAALHAGFDQSKPGVNIDVSQASLAAAAASFDPARFSTFDLHARMPQWSAPPVGSSSAAPVHDVHKVWDADRVHFSVRGYDRIGEQLAEVIVQTTLLGETFSAAPVKTAAACAAL